MFFILLIVFAGLFFTNFSPSTYLTGWDNLHPEANILLNIHRSFFAVWQEYQGLGLLGGMGHASDLIRQLIFIVPSLVIPEHLIRQLYIFGMLILGPIGVYNLINKLIASHLHENAKRVAATTGALFYLLNLATIQNFYVPYESFVHHFGFLPWLVYSLFNYLLKPSKRSFILFTAINFLAVPQSYVPTIFLVFFGAVTLSSFLLYLKDKSIGFKRLVSALSLILVINSFWLLPFLYFNFTNNKVVFNAKINQTATEEVFLKNKEFGDIGDVAVLKGFWFNTTDYNSRVSDYVFLMEPWKDYFRNSFINILGYILFGLIIFGIYNSYKQKNKFFLPLISLFLISFTALSNNTPVFSFLDELIYKFPIIAQALRFPFTKFSTLLALSYSIFLAFAAAAIYLFVEKKIKKIKYLHIFISILFATLFIILTFPAFKGYLFYPQIKVNPPAEYKQLKSYLDSQNPNMRIANFPQNTFWGWTHYKWGYGGSGFLWYGTSQPILDRAFDVWSNYDENYYWEISYALDTKNPILLDAILEKYQISWLLLDDNVLNPFAQSNYNEELGKLLEKSKTAKLSQTFGKIKLYRVNLKTPANNFIYVAQNIKNINPEYNFSQYDQAFLDTGLYQTSSHQAGINYFYPFRSLFTGKNQEDLEFYTEVQDNAIIFKKKLPQDLSGFKIKVPDITDTEFVWVDQKDLNQVGYFLPKVTSDGKELVVLIPKINGLFGETIDITKTKNVKNAKKCNQFNAGNFSQNLGDVKSEILKEGDLEFVRLSSVRATNCSASVWFPNAPQKYGFLISVKSRNVKGKPITFWLENLTTKGSDIQTQLSKSKDFTTSYFIQPPLSADGLGYSLHFDNVSIEGNESINDLAEVKIYPIPLSFLQSIYYEKDSKLDSSKDQSIKFVTNFSIKHPNTAFYRVKFIDQFHSEKNSFLVLSQGYDAGWIAFNGSIFRPILDHVKVNNWENGWILKGGNDYKNVYIFYLPQLLEFLGFLIIAVTFLNIFSKREY